MTTLGRVGHPAMRTLPVVPVVADVAAGKRALVRAMTDLEEICAEANRLVDRLTVGLQRLETEPEGERYWQLRDHWGCLRSRLKYLGYDETDKWTGELIYAGAWRRGLAVLTAYAALAAAETHEAAVARQGAERHYGPFIGPRGEYRFFIVRWPKARIAGLDSRTPGWLWRVG